MEKNKEAYQMSFRVLNFIYFAILFGVLTFAVIVVVLHLDEGAFMKTAQIVQTLRIGAVATLFLIPIGYWIHQKKIATIEKDIDLLEKLNLYKSSFIVKIALIECTGFCAIAIFMLTGDYIVLTLVVVTLIVLVINRPTLEKLRQELDLSDSEIESMKG